MKKQALLLLATIPFMAHSFGQNSEFMIKAGLGHIPNMSANENFNPKYHNPHIELSYFHPIYKNLQLGVGIKYNYKSFLQKSRRNHLFNKDGKIIDQEIRESEDYTLHQIGLPITLKYSFPKVKFSPAVYIGILPQYAVSGEFNTSTDLYFDKVYNASNSEYFDINDEKFNSNAFKDFKQYTQFFIGAEASINNQFGLSISYQYNRKNLAFYLDNTSPVPEDLAFSRHYKDQQFQLSVFYKFSN